MTAGNINDLSRNSYFNQNGSTELAIPQVSQHYLSKAKGGLDNYSYINK
jgi:hypothetical protein